ISRKTAIARLLFWTGSQGRVVQDGTGVLRTEVDPAGNRLVVQRAVGAQAGIKTEAAPRQVHSRPQPETANKTLEFFAGTVLVRRSQAVRRNQQTGGGGQQRNQDGDQDSASGMLHAFTWDRRNLGRPRTRNRQRVSPQH